MYVGNGADTIMCYSVDVLGWWTTRRGKPFTTCYRDELPQYQFNNFVKIYSSRNSNSLTFRRLDEDMT